MRRVTLKGLLAHKLRLALTALSVVLGVGFVAGTLVLTDTLGHTFDNLFAEVNGHTDAQVRSAKKLNPTDPSAADREPLPARLLDAVKGVDGVAEAGGSVTGFARMIDREGTPIGGGNAPTFGASASNLGTLSPFSIKKGRAPNGSNEAVIDAGTAKSHNLKVGARIKVQSSGPTQTFTVVGIVGFGSADNLAGATFVLFDVPTAH